MRLRVNPDNPTEIWGALDDREPSVEDNDFGADFSFYPDAESEAATTRAVAEIVERVNAG